MEVKDILRITLAQIDVEWENPEQNRRDIEEQIMQLTGNSDLVILPETFTTGFSVRNTHLAEAMNGPTINWMLHLSQISGIAIAGSLIIIANGLYYNRFVFITPKGEISFYDKRHLFSIGGESDFLSSGDQRKIVHYLGWRIALYVCYDIRFPVWCRNVNDTDLMIFTANWPDSRSEVWTLLLRTRAIENQVYVAGVNRTGTDGNGDFYKGESQMINARGELIPLTVITGSNLLSYEISKQVLNDFRDKFPVANDADRFLII